MIIIPGVFISLITFPGIIMHELAHQLFCRICRVAVFDVCYLRTQNPAGYVVHEIPKNPVHGMMIGLGPFIFNTVLGALITLPSAMPVIKFKSGTILDYFLMWVGVSIAMHAFPSTADTQNMLEASKNKDVHIVLRVITKPLVWFINILSAGSVIWLDYFYGLGVALGIPYVLVKILA